MILLSVTRSIYGTQNGCLKAPDELADASDEELVKYANDHEYDIEWDELPEDLGQLDEVGIIYLASIEEEDNDEN